MNRISLNIFLLFCLLFNFQTYGQKKNEKVLVYGIIRNYTDVIEVVDNDYTESFSIGNAERSFVPDSSGNFSIEFVIKEPKYFRIARNLVYLSPGDKLYADIDYNNARNSTFKGSHYQENEYLKFIPYPKAGSFVEAGRSVKSTLDQTFLVLLDSAKQSRKRLFGFNNLSTDFKFFEQNRINADLLNSFYSLRQYYPRVNKIEGDSLTAFYTSFSTIVDDYAKKYVPLKIDSRLMKLEAYRDIALRIIKLKSSETSSDVAIINDWFFAKQMMHEMKTDGNGFDLKNIDRVKTIKYRDEVLNTYYKLLSLNGTNAIDLDLEDPNGKSIKLSSLKGKFIYIDVWATWCGPCIKELPYLDSLKEKFKEFKDIAFLSLSIDRNTANWINYLTKNQLTGYQYIIDLSSLEPYHVSEIPRTTLIDKSFTIYAMRGPKPSSLDATKILLQMLKQP